MVCCSRQLVIVIGGQKKQNYFKMWKHFTETSIPEQFCVKMNINIFKSECLKSSVSDASYKKTSWTRFRELIFIRKKIMFYSNDQSSTLFESPTVLATILVFPGQIKKSENLKYTNLDCWIPQWLAHRF